MEPKLVKTNEEYESALSRIEELMDHDPEPGTPDAEELETLGLLVQDYESKLFPIEHIDPIEAIEFRMDQQGLAPRDLIPYVGSRSKVYDVLARRRPLSLAMVRSLSTGLGIPAELLLGENHLSESTEMDWDKFPIKEMVRRGYVRGAPREAGDNAQLLLGRLFETAGLQFDTFALFTKRTTYIREGRAMDRYALLAWAAEVALRARDEQETQYYQEGTVTPDFMRQVALKSRLDNGPLAAIRFLRENGILVIILPHLPKTYIDGATIRIQGFGPIIGLTLRYDRIDNFWFALEHELAHISRHFNSDMRAFFDDLEIQNQVDPREREADELAAEALIPEKDWKNTPASTWRTPDAVQRSAEILRIHPAIVAGRIRYQYKSFRVLKDWVGYGQIREYFPEIKWE